MGGRDCLQAFPLVRKPPSPHSCFFAKNISDWPLDLVQLTGGVRSSTRLRAQNYPARLASAQEVSVTTSAGTVCQVSLITTDAKTWTGVSDSTQNFPSEVNSVRNAACCLYARGRSDQAVFVSGKRHALQCRQGSAFQAITYQVYVSDPDSRCTSAGPFQCSLLRDASTGP